MKSLFFLFFGTVFHRGLAEFYCVFSRCERLNFDQFPGRDMIVLCAFCVVLGSAVSLPDASHASDKKDSTPQYAGGLLRCGISNCLGRLMGWSLRCCLCMMA